MRKLLWRNLRSHRDGMHTAYVSRSTEGSWDLHTHDFYEIFLVDSGAGQHRLPGQSIPLRPGCVAFVRPADIHGFRAKASSEPFALINIAFPEVAWRDLARRYPRGMGGFFDETTNRPPLRELGGGQAHEVRHLFHLALSGERGAVARDAFLLSLAGHLQVKSQEEAIGEHVPAWLRQGIMGLPSDGEALAGGPSELAKRCGCSPAHLSRTMRSVTGCTPGAYLLRLRLQRAVGLLETTGLSITEVALESGFNNLSHFHMCFRKAYHISPLQHRKHHTRHVV